MKMDTDNGRETIIARGRYVLCKALDDEEVLTVPGAGVLSVDGRIEEIGPYDDLVRRYPDARVIGSYDHVVLPGFVNAHHHMGLTPVQLGTNDLPLEQWLVAQMQSRRVDQYLDTLYSAFKLVGSGVTAVQHLAVMLPPPLGNWTDSGRKTIQAYLDLGMRVSYAQCVRDQHRLVYAPDEEFLATLPAVLAAETKRFLDRTHFRLEDFETEVLQPLIRAFGDHPQSNMVRVWLAPINMERCSDRLLSLNKEWARKYGIGIHLHLSETIYQKMFAARRFGMSSVQHLHRIGFLGPEVTLGHAVWASEEDLEIVAGSGCALCHNASSNLRIRSGIAPVGDFLKHQIPVALGIDEAGLNDDRDMLQEIRLVKHIHCNPGIFTPRITPAQIFRMATEQGARACGFGDEIGSIEVGKKADLLVLNYRNITRPYLDPAMGVLESIIYRARSSDVETVIIDGVVVFDDGRFTRVDREAVMGELERSLSKPRSPSEVERKRLYSALFPHVRDFYRDWTLPTLQPRYQLNSVQ